jgi:polysaccharide pyruvyl transferase WcaK-like protein
VRNALNRHDILFVRDAFSHAALDRLGVTTRVVDSTDAAVFLQAAPDPAYAHVERRIDAARERQRLVVCVRDYQPRYAEALQARERVLTTLALVLDHVQQSLADVFFLGTDHQPQESKHTDLFIAEQVRSRMKVAGAVILDEDVANAAALKSQYGKFDAMISMRLHPTILALDGGVPCLILAYDDKCQDFFRSLELEDFVTPVTDFDAARGIRQVTDLLRTPGLGERIRARYARLRAAHASDWDPMFEQIAARVQVLRGGQAPPARAATARPA